jgi:DHA2 family multidrug resistance protein
MLNTQTQSFLAGTQSTMMRHGGDPVAAATQSYVALWGTVQRQSSMLAFVDTFRAMAIVFLLVLPFLFIMKRPKHHRSAGPMH